MSTPVSIWSGSIGAICIAMVLLTAAPAVYGAPAGLSPTDSGTCSNQENHPVCVSRGDPAPRFELRDLKRNWHRMSRYVGKSSRGKPVVIDFFAMDCAVCKEMVPALVDFARRYSGRVQVIVIALTDPSDRDDRKLREFFRAAGAGFPVLIDPRGAEAARWVEVQDGRAVLPHLFLVDSVGFVRDMAGGRHDSIDAALPELKTVVSP